MAYNLETLKKDINQIVKIEISNFKRELIADLRQVIEDQVKVQMADVWDKVSNTAESKITHATIQLQASVDSFKKESGDKLDHFSAILKGLNELNAHMTKAEDSMVTFYRLQERHKTQLDRAIPEIIAHEKRINDLEDKPGENALSRNRDNKAIFIKILVGIAISISSLGIGLLIARLTGG